MTEQSEFATDLTSLAARVGERIGGVQIAMGRLERVA
jgi:hypothetical protein